MNFASLYSNIPVQDAMNAIQELANLGIYKILFLMLNLCSIIEHSFKNSLITFEGEYFQQIFGMIMGTNVAPILANIYRLENILKRKS